MQKLPLTLVALAATLISSAPAVASTISGTIKGGKGTTVVVVQSNGKARKSTITAAAGTFKITGITATGASIHLVAADGSYWGPLVLGGAGTKVYETVKGWKGSTRGARSWTQLPGEAVKYVRRLEELVGKPVALLSTSPEREDVILMRDPFEK